ncbi:carbohydrate esterase family 9 protein [Truncatella angustata]|uniref:Carbohydrate esterase family 9 protein n=1 Tax=Truncatella angustata TaxID=152316 RepID=A0A9P9A329_9PEZI|nr:carbohydrate esterase family 9 protein [Truncatella angustata]KAH6661396.1 carbohydrate esterase family 9 protein [Truncatella angustata]
MAPRKNEFAAQLSPPPYEVEAYTYRRPQFRRRLRRACSFPIVIALGLSFAVSYLCLLIGRETLLRSSTSDAFASVALQKFEKSIQQCAARTRFPLEVPPESRKENPRWNGVRGQNETIALRNATLFDGVSFASAPVDIIFSKGLITAVSPASSAESILENGAQYNLDGRYVTPGLVDMHSHHLEMPWPGVEAVDDGNEMHELFGPLTPFVKITESLKAYDKATKIIASGGVTSSLLIPGSANIMGGEGTVVKNIAKAGELGEYVVEEMLLEHGINIEDRHRYMKFACGENPKRVYGHTRMGLAYMLRRHLTRAKELMDDQDAWCDAATKLRTDAQRIYFTEEKGRLPEQLELESTIALIRGQVAMHNHCYEPQDFETMLGVVQEFGIHVRAFHHAIEAWQVPEMIKAYGGNITIATFASDSLYKHEAYHPSLYAGAILDAHGLAVAYKSDHGDESTNAKYILSQAAAGHAFHLPAEKALQSVTSIPAKAIDQGNRIGYVRVGYDADIVVWDDHPLSIGTTPQQVFIDGVATLNSRDVQVSTGSSMESAVKTRRISEPPVMRQRYQPEDTESFCASAKRQSTSFVIQGIRKSFLDNHSDLSASVSTTGADNLTLVVHAGRVSCLDTSALCAKEITATSDDAVHVTLQNGHLLPGLTAVTYSLGMKEIYMEEDTGNGVARAKDIKDPASVDYAKYGVYLDGKAFARARVGGITRAITAPEFPTVDWQPSGLVQGVSVGIRTSGTKTILNGGIFQDEVGLHVVIGQANRGIGSVSMAIKTLRTILTENKGKGNESAFGLVADGRMPVLINVDSVPHTQQIVLLKKDFPNVNIVIDGGHGAPLLAEELAAANISVILSKTRPAPAHFDTKDTLVGPPLTRSPASVLSEAGVHYAISVADEMADSRIHDLVLEASWVAKYAGLTEHEAVQLVTKNVETILGLKPSKDIVVWENNPLQYGGSVVLTFEETADGMLALGTCWPDDTMDNSY